MRKLLVAVLSVVLFGCATPYQPFELFGRGGYQDRQISNDTYQISYYGNGATNLQTLNSLLLYRTAEIASDKGFDYFEVLRGSGRIPLSAAGGFKRVEHTVRMYQGAPVKMTSSIFMVKNVKDEFGPYIKQQK